jgi:hypothetical protein
MNWEKFILSTNPSALIKEIIAKINQETHFNGKYIGVIPIYWDGLEIYQQNKLKAQKYKNNLEMMNNEELNLDNLDINEIVKNIYTNKTKLILNREFYYLGKKNNIEQEPAFYPVYQFPDNISFTLRNIQEYIIKKLLLDRESNNTYDIFRIYKMSGFHLFVLLTSHRLNLNFDQVVPNIDLSNNLNNLEWKINKGIELLSINDNEIINSFMKVSNDKFINNTYGSNWFQKINGNCVLNNKEFTFPFEINWSEIIATLGNFIDNEPNDNLHLYFKAHIIDETKNMLAIFNELHRKKPKLTDDIL